MDGRVMILGGGVDNLPLIERANALGLQTHVLDMFRDCPGADIAQHYHSVSFGDPEATLRVAREVRPDGICTTYDSAVLPSARVAAELGLSGLSVESALIVSAKDRMREVFTQRGIGCPRYYRTPDPTSDVLLPLPVVVKPLDMSGSKGVSLVLVSEDLTPALHRAIEVSRAGIAVVDEYLAGRQFDVEAVAVGGKVLVLEIVEEFYEPPHFYKRQFVAPAPISAKLREVIIALVREAVRAVGIGDGVVHCELRLDEVGRPRIIEIGGRAGGGTYHSLVDGPSGHDILRYTLEICLGQRPEVAPGHSGDALLLRSLYTKRDALLAGILRESPNVEVVSEQVWAEPMDDEPTGSGQSNGEIFLAGPTPEACLIASAAATAATEET